MNYRDLIVAKYDGTPMWEAMPSLWPSVQPQDIANAATHEFFHFLGSNYNSKNLGQDPLAMRLCQMLGTNLTALRNRNFGVTLYILPDTTLPFPDLPPFSNFVIERQEVSKNFFKKVADALLQDKSAAALIDNFNSVVMTSQSAIRRLRKIDVTNLIVTGGWAIYESIMNAASSGAHIQRFGLSLAVLVTGMAFTRTRILKHRHTQNVALGQLRKRVSEVAGRQWAEQALRYDFAVNLLMTPDLMDGSPRISFQEFRGEASDKIRQIVDNAEDNAINNPLGHEAYVFYARPNSRALGSTFVAMAVTPSGNPTPPKTPKKPLAKLFGWRPEWDWIPRPASSALG